MTIIDNIKFDDKSIDDTNTYKNSQLILNNKFNFMNTETNQTYDNQVLFTEKNSFQDKDLSYINKNKNILQTISTGNGNGNGGKFFINF